MINLKLKERDRFNLNDAFIEAYKALPASEDYNQRREELQNIVHDEVDLLKNVNILSIFAMSGSQ